MVFSRVVSNYSVKIQSLENVCVDSVDDGHIVHVRTRHRIIVIHRIVVQKDYEIHRINIR